MASVAETYKAVEKLDVGTSVPRQVKIKTPSETYVKVLKSVIVVLAVVLGIFMWLALRNARPLVIDSIGTDDGGNTVYEIRMDKGVNQW